MISKRHSHKPMTKPMTMKPDKITKILFADDHQIVREGLARLIDRERDLEIIAETDNGADAVNLARTLAPDLIILDLKMPQKDGATAAIEILSENPAAKIMLLTSFATATEVKAALDAGALSAIIKDCSSEELIDAIRGTMRGERTISQEIADALDAQEPQATLSLRQKEILSLVSKGFNNGEIADRVGITRHGVKAHLAIIFKRLGAASRAEAASLGLSLGII